MVDKSQCDYARVRQLIGRLWLLCIVQPSGVPLHQWRGLKRRELDSLRGLVGGLTALENGFRRLVTAIDDEQAPDGHFRNMLVALRAHELGEL